MGGSLGLPTSALTDLPTGTLSQWLPTMILGSSNIQSVTEEVQEGNLLEGFLATDTWVH